MSAAYQLIACVGSPVMQINTVHGPGMFTAGAFQYIVETSVPDILKEGDQAGMSIAEIASKMKHPPPGNNHLARILRYLASRHVFREVRPNVFANNRTSSALCKAKSVKEIHEDPLSQYDGLTAAAMVGHATDEGLRAISHLSVWLQAPKTTVGPSSFAAAHKIENMWTWFEQPENEMRRNRFTGVMKTLNDGVFKEDLFTGAIDWASYPDMATVVDVGGNIGTVSLLLARKFPHLNFVVQDLPQVIETDTRRFWDKEWPEYVQQGKVHLQPYDFFTPNPVKEADIYFLRTILHDWDTPRAACILKHLRDAAKPSTKLIVFDMVMPYACLDPSDKNSTNVPWPLLPNLGLAGGGAATIMDLHMMTLFDAQERTAAEFTELGTMSGWKIEKIVPVTGAIGAVVYVPL